MRIEEGMAVKTLVERKGYKAGSIGVVVSIYNDGTECEVEIWDETQYPVDVVTYVFYELEEIYLHGELEEVEMSKINSERKNCKDVFKTVLLENVKYAGEFEFPVIHTCDEEPNRLIRFSDAISSKDYDQWVHFYEDDYKIERIWNNPLNYLECLKKYKGVILPDFSLYRDMPLAMQIWNIYRSRAIGNWLQNNGIKVIPNIRYGGMSTYYISTNGIDKDSIIAVGSHGNIKCNEDRKIFLDGLDLVCQVLNPHTIVVYGSTPDEYFRKYRDKGIKILQFDSNFACSHDGK